jgi:hypothetical protein
MHYVGIFVNMKATLLYRHREDFDDGAILEVVIWSLPQPLLGSSHRYKYRLFYGFPGRRILGYDNERGKGDHRHSGDEEKLYEFTTPDRLIEDFLVDVRRLR